MKIDSLVSEAVNAVPSELLRYVESGEPIPLSLMLSALNAADNSRQDEQCRRIANGIMAEAGDYLPSYALRAFIRADLSDIDAKKLINDRKVFVIRGCDLFPSILNLIKVKDPEPVNLILSEIYDCCYGFAISDKSEHLNVKLKKTKKNIDAVKFHISKLISALDEAKWVLDLEFNQHMEANSRMMSRRRKKIIDLDDLRYSLKQLKFTSSVSNIKDELRIDKFIISDNKSRTLIVNHVYDIFLRYGNPKFTTTPGSDFSMLCGLILELATGITDESFAGAIAKFSRSPSRQERDNDQRLTDWENSDEWIEEKLADNFGAIKERTSELMKELTLWNELPNYAAWDEFEIEQIERRILDVERQIDSANSEHGPFLIFVDQAGTPHLGLEKLMAMDALLLEAEIEVGRLKRAKELR